tara:strand:+ start:256 stop:597 length:342 start_codon:yes stop_codon:yes gene_type:complete
MDDLSDLLASVSDISYELDIAELRQWALDTLNMDQNGALLFAVNAAQEQRRLDQEAVRKRNLSLLLFRIGERRKLVKAVLSENELANKKDVRVDVCAITKLLEKLNNAFNTNK